MPLTSELFLMAEPRHILAVVAPTGGGKDRAGEPGDAVRRAGRRGDHPGVDITAMTLE